MSLKGRLHKYLLGVIDTTPREFIKTAECGKTKPLEHLSFKKTKYVRKKIKE